MLNFLPDKNKKNIILEYILRTFVFLFSFILIALLLLTFLFVPSAFFSKYKNKTVTDQLQSVKMINSTQGIDAVALIKKLNGIVKVLSNNNQKNIAASDLIHKIITLKSSSIKIYSISIANDDPNQEKIILTGVADTRDDLTAFDTHLVSDGIFASVDLPVANLIKNTDADFTITLVYNKK